MRRGRLRCGGGTGFEDVCSSGGLEWLDLYYLRDELCRIMERSSTAPDSSHQHLQDACIDATSRDDSRSEASIYRVRYPAWHHERTAYDEKLAVRTKL